MKQENDREKKQTNIKDERVQERQGKAKKLKLEIKKMRLNLKFSYR